MFHTTAAAQAEKGLRLESREQLVHLLAEAAELEHNLLCCYLYAAFSLKKGAQSGFSPEDQALVEKWRSSILQVAVEEMTHLALIANLTVAIGCLPHFNRPNLPVPALYHPADIVVELAPFNLDTLDHFIYLERPDGSDLPDGKSFARRREDYQRGERPGASLMPSAVDYDTISEFYAHLRDCFIALSGTAGEAKLFCGPISLQVGLDAVDLPGMTTVACLSDALRALDTIVTQGEGGGKAAERPEDKSHFARFTAIRAELVQSQARLKPLEAAWPAARNPLMRKPSDPSAGLHVTEPAAAAVLDLGNAVYALTLRLLTQAWERQEKNSASAAAALEAAMRLMRLLGGVGEHLCSLPARIGDPSGAHAGLTFTMPRATEPLVESAQTLWINERLAELEIGLQLVGESQPALRRLVPQLQAISKNYRQACGPAKPQDEAAKRGDQAVASAGR